MILRAHLFFCLLLMRNINIYKAQSQRENQKYEIYLGPCQIQILESCDSPAIKFYLYSSLDNGIQLNSTNPKIPDTYIPNAPIKVVIPGWAGSQTTNFTDTVRDAYLTSPDPFNVIVVDWNALSKVLCYASSVLNTHQVASCTSQLLSGLAKQDPHWDPAKIHLVGHSLGAHIAAFTSNNLLASTGRKAGRITGLDPALPGFVTVWTIAKLDPTDADFVDVMHTNAGIYGKMEPSGHADFYVNGGSNQPFCDFPGRQPAACSHLIAMYYFAESINQRNSFYGTPCVPDVPLLITTKQSATSPNPKWWTSSPLTRCPSPSSANQPQWIGAYMGDGADTRARGTFYVETAASYPFGLGRPASGSKFFFIAPIYVQEYEYLYFNK